MLLFTNAKIYQVILTEFIKLIEILFTLSCKTTSPCLHQNMKNSKHLIAVTKVNNLDKLIL